MIPSFSLSHFNVSRVCFRVSFFFLSTFLFIRTSKSPNDSSKYERVSIHRSWHATRWWMVSLSGVLWHEIFNEIWQIYGWKISKVHNAFDGLKYFLFSFLLTIFHVEIEYLYTYIWYDFLFASTIFQEAKAPFHISMYPAERSRCARAQEWIFTTCWFSIVTKRWTFLKYHDLDSKQRDCNTRAILHLSQRK